MFIKEPSDTALVQLYLVKPAEWGLSRSQRPRDVY